MLLSFINVWVIVFHSQAPKKSENNASNMIFHTYGGVAVIQKVPILFLWWRLADITNPAEIDVSFQFIGDYLLCFVWEWLAGWTV
jgi:hypothetical protein